MIPSTQYTRVGNISIAYQVIGSGPVDLVLVPGGQGTRREVENRALCDWLGGTASRCAWVTSVCTGSLLLHAAGEPTSGWRREHLSSAVMMIPIPRTGTFRRVDGVEAAGAVPYIDEVQITAKPDQQLHALPEGASYLGFIFGRAATPSDAEGSVREAHARLRFTIDPLIPVSAG